MSFYIRVPFKKGLLHLMRKSEYKEEKKKEIMEKCFECYCDNGLRNTGIKDLGKYCGMTSANLYAYFNSVDDLIIQSTGYRNWKKRGRTADILS